MHVEERGVLLRPADKQGGAEERTPREVEGPAVVRRFEARHLRPADLGGQGREVDHGSGNGVRRQDVLERLAALGDEDGAQPLVPAHHLVHDAGEDRDRQRPGHLDEVEQVVDRRSGVELVEGTTSAPERRRAAARSAARAPERTGIRRVSGAAPAAGAAAPPPRASRSTSASWVSVAAPSSGWSGSSARKVSRSREATWVASSEWPPSS